MKQFTLCHFLYVGEGLHLLCSLVAVELPGQYDLKRSHMSNVRVPQAGDLAREEAQHTRRESCQPCGLVVGRLNHDGV